MSTVNPVQFDIYELKPSNNPITFGAGTSIETESGVAVYGGPGTSWTVTNAGRINGAGGPITVTGCMGMRMESYASVTNQTGGRISGYGIGVYLAKGGYLTNAGTINGTSPPTNLGDGDGAWLAAGGKVSNSGTILASGAYGVYAAGAATITNSGTISATSGVSVEFKSASDRLVVESGSKLVGGAAVGGAGTLEIAGGAGTMTGLGGAGSLSGDTSGSFGGFGAYAVDAGADWGLAGPSSLGASQSLNVAGKVKLGSAASLANAGKLTAAVGGVAKLEGAVTNTGVIKAKGKIVVGQALINDGKLKVADGTLSVLGAVTGTGTVSINGGTLNLAAAFDQNVTFKAGTGELVLADSQAYTGTITGFSTAGGATLDLKDIGFVNANEATFSGTASGGTLTVTDGTHTAKIALSGDYLSSTFTASSDGHGGVLVVDPPKVAMVQHFAAHMAALEPSAGFAAIGAYGRLPPRQPMLAAGRTSLV